MEVVVSRQNGGLPEVIENQENKNQNKPEVLHPVQKGGVSPSDLSPANDRLRETATERISMETSSENASLDSRVTLGAANPEESTSSSSRSEELSNKNGKVWDCVEAKVDPESGGTLYTFAFNQENASCYSSVYRGTFPAVEYELYDIENLFDNMREPDLMGRLGYRLDKENKTITVPDSQVFSHRWKKEQKNDPTLPDFKICDAEGIASDEDFIEAMFTHDVVLSSSNEMVHDHFAHVIPLVQQILETEPDHRLEKYTNARTLFRELIREVWDEVQTIKAEIDTNGETNITKDELSKIITMIGLTVDSVNAHSFFNEISGLIEDASDCEGSILNTFLQFALSYEWFNYMSERYPNVSEEELRALPKKLSQSHNEHKNAREQVKGDKYPCLSRSIDSTAFSSYSYSMRKNRVVDSAFHDFKQEKRRALGYHFSSQDSACECFFPDAKTLDLRWKQMQKDNPNLPDFQIYTALKEPNKLHELLNESSEFFSNHLFLVVPSILAAFEAETPEQLPKLAKFREGLVLELMQLQEQVENLNRQWQQGNLSSISERELEYINDFLDYKLLMAMRRHSTIELAEKFPDGKGILDYLVDTAYYSPRDMDMEKAAWAKFREHSNSL
ncbi:MAG: hypothetical protein KFB95_08160 [Simkaniaceae bacterium]|nr:MAG: hypothetical protein KFB95_08160 [Simkaniaceae bacterium]